MKPLFKWALRLGLLAAVLGGLFLVFRNSIWRAVTEHRIRTRTGMKVTIGKFSSGLFSPVVTITDLKLYNTAEFGGALFLDIPELHLEMDRAALARHKLRITLARFNLAELAVVKNAAGQTNVTSLLRQTAPQSSEQEKAGKLLGDFEFEGVDVLHLTLGKARFIDLKDATRNRELQVNLRNQRFKNVRSEADVYGMLVLIALSSGAKFSLPPAVLAGDHGGRQSGKIEAAVPSAVEKTPVPAGK